MQNAKHCEVCANANCQCEHHGEGEARSLVKLANGLAQILLKAVWEHCHNTCA
jgi:hypothetical protein